MWNHKGGSSKFGDSLCSYCRYIQPSCMWVLVIECFRLEILFCTLCYLYKHSMICFLLSFKTLHDNHYYYYFYLSSIHEVKHALWLLYCNSSLAYSLIFMVKLDKFTIVYTQWSPHFPCFSCHVYMFWHYFPLLICVISGFELIYLVEQIILSPI